MPRSAVSPLEDLFYGCDGTERVRRFEAYKASMDVSQKMADSGNYSFIPQVGILPTGGVKKIQKLLSKFDDGGDIRKGLTADAASELQADLDAARAAVADITKDWTTSFPDSSGLVPYDLQAGIKHLIPFETPIRNTTPRNQQGKGLATHWKRLLGLSNAGVGGVATLSPFMNSQTVQTSFGSLALRRGQKITYATDSQAASYVEMGYSDQVNWAAYFAGLGFDNVRQLSQHALTWAHLLGEERAMLYARGASGNGYLGAVSAPVISAADSGQAGSLAASAYKIVVLATGGFGTTVQSNEVTVTPTVNHGITVTVTTEPTGGLNYQLFVTAAGGGTGTETFQTNFVGNTVTFTAVSAGAALPANSDTTADTNGFDGWIPAVAANGGYVKRVNGKLSTSNPGTELQTAFQAMYQLNRSNPDDAWFDSGVMVELGDLLKSASSAPYRIALSNDGGTQGTLGTAVTGIENQVTRKMVEFNVHPFMPTGAGLIRSLRLPFPAEGITNTAEMRLVQDYMAIDWPAIQFTWDASTYVFGTMVHYAPAWSGLLLGIQ
ncbi:hypothetical protein [Streptomyces mirabilis]|uniref:hypothetical protein n=1 Tax=Streptomyces mirabilis TaxID=68239 RepID=UPI0036A24B78